MDDLFQQGNFGVRGMSRPETMTTDFLPSMGPALRQAFGMPAVAPAPVPTYDTYTPAPGFDTVRGVGLQPLAPVAPAPVAAAPAPAPAREARAAPPPKVLTPEQWERVLKAIPPTDNARDLMMKRAMTLNEKFMADDIAAAKGDKAKEAMAIRDGWVRYQSLFSPSGIMAEQIGTQRK